MEQKKQAIAGDVVVLSGAVICGDVSIASGSSVCFNAVVRGDEAPISIGENTNIQDCAVLHVDEDCPLRIGTEIPEGWMAFGNPAKPVRRLRPEEIEGNRRSCETYLKEKERYRT